MDIDIFRIVKRIYLIVGHKGNSEKHKQEILMERKVGSIVKIQHHYLQKQYRVYSVSLTFYLFHIILYKHINDYFVCGKTISMFWAKEETCF